MPDINAPTPDATTTTKGKVQLSGNLSGTAAAPTVVSMSTSTQTDNSNTIANTAQSALKVYYGWGQILGSGTAGMSELVTFPAAFSTVLGVEVCWIGFKSGGTAATSITNFNTKIGAGVNIEPVPITNSGFTMQATSTGIFGAAYHGYSWIAWGI